MTEMGLGGKKKHFFFYGPIPKLFHFGIMQMFQIPLPLQEALLRAHNALLCSQLHFIIFHAKKSK